MGDADGVGLGVALAVGDGSSVPLALHALAAAAKKSTLATARFKKWYAMTFELVLHATVTGVGRPPARKSLSRASPVTSARRTTNSRPPPPSRATPQ